MSFPKTNTSSIIINEIETTIQCTTFDDKHLIIISQLDNFGTWLYANIDECINGKILYQTKILLGKRDNAVLYIYARQLIEQIYKTGNISKLNNLKPLVLSISLHQNNNDAKSMQDILNKLFEINTWQ